MNKSLREVLVGLLLGDGHIRRSGSNKAYITFEQSLKKKDYLQHVQDILKQEAKTLTSKFGLEGKGGKQNPSRRFYWYAEIQGGAWDTGHGRPGTGVLWFALFFFLLVFFFSRQHNTRRVGIRALHRRKKGKHGNTL